MSQQQSTPKLTDLQADVLEAVPDAGIADVRGVQEAYENRTGTSATEPSIQNHLNTLVAKGLLETTPTPQQRSLGRQYLLTDQGQEVIEADV